MKIQLELVVHEEPDGRIFLNYWDYKHGKDVCCQLKNDQLFLLEYSDQTDDFNERKISLSEFIKLVQASI